LHSVERCLDIGHVGCIDEVGTKTATSKSELGRRLIKDSLATAPVDARVVRSWLGRVEQRRLVLVGIFEADPLVSFFG
jgi:hypothetical protein